MQTGLRPHCRQQQSISHHTPLGRSRCHIPFKSYLEPRRTKCSVSDVFAANRLDLEVSFYFLL